MAEETKKETKIVTLDQLLGSKEQQTSVVYLEELGGSIEIRKLTLGDIAKVNSFNKSKGWLDDDMRSTIGIIQRGVVKPKLQYSQAEDLDLRKATAIVNAITDFSGFADGELDAARDLSEETTESI